MTVAYRFTGESGSFVVGIPARDLFAEELADLASDRALTRDELVALLDASPVYVAETP